MKEIFTSTTCAGIYKCMLYLPHFLTGAAFLKIVPNPIIGLPLALASHFFLDLTAPDSIEFEALNL